jgi:lysophospholipase L1-like esterase
MQPVVKLEHSDGFEPLPSGGLRFLGLGDSLTQGVGDPQPGRAGFAGELDGWVSHFTNAVRESGQTVAVCNLAVAGARIEHVIAEQLPLAVANPADIASCFIGVNDLWDANVDCAEFGERFHRVFRELSAVSPVLITATIHDVFAPFPVKPPLRQKLSSNTALMNDAIRSAVNEYGLILIDFAGRPELFTPAVRAIDRLHPNRYGHQLIAAEVVTQMHDRGHLLGVTPPEAHPIGRGSHDLAHIAWVAGYVKHNWGRWRAEVEASKAKSTDSPK